MLNDTAVIFVCRQQILPKEPGSIRRDIIHRIKLITHKRGRHQADTFLRELRTNGVHVAERGCQPIKAVTTLRCALNSPFLILASRRRWRHDFPSEGSSMFRIRCKQSMQERGAAAGQADDKQRFANFLPCNARIELPVAMHEQTGTQCAHKIGPKSDLPYQVKARLAVAGIEQSRETLEKISSTKIIETATALRCFDQIHCTKRRARNSGFLQQCAAAIEKPHRQDWASLVESRGERIHLRRNV